MVTKEFVERYKGTDIYKSVKTREDNHVLWVLYYADGFPHKVGSLVLNRISSPALWSVKKQISKYKKNENNYGSNNQYIDILRNRRRCSDGRNLFIREVH